MNEHLNALAVKFADRYEISIDMAGYDDQYAALEDDILCRCTCEELDESTRRKWEIVEMKWRLLKKQLERETA